MSAAAVEADVLDAALAYAAAGRAVFPCKPTGPAAKAPYTAHGFRDASCDAETVAAWWRKWPDALIGAPVPHGEVALDLDPKNGGRLDDLPELPVTLTTWSGRGDGGRHFYFRHPGGVLSQPALDAAIAARVERPAKVPDPSGRVDQGGSPVMVNNLGWDLRDGGRHYLILPPSPHPDTGKPYVWDAPGRPVAAMPGWLAAMLRGPESPPAPAASTHLASLDIGGGGPITDYNSQTRLADLLEPAGWTIVRGDGQSDGSLWRHPSATASTSASVQSGRLYNYSTTPGLPLAGPREGGLSPFDLLAHLHYRGDTADALRSISTSAAALAAWTPPEPSTTTATAGPDPYAAAVAREANRQRIVADARDYLANERARAEFREPPGWDTLTAALAEPDEPVAYLVDGLLPAGGNAVLAAEFKSGKTTIGNNLTRALVDGEPFLGRFAVTAPAGRVALFNYEVGESQFRRWLRAAGIANTDAVCVLNLRGHRLQMTTRHGEDWAVRWLRDHDVAVWIVDPFARAFGGVSEK